MEFHHDVHLAADRVADLAERHKSGIELGGGDRAPLDRLGREIERPDLHRRDALLEQGLRQFVGPVQKGVQILVGAGRRSRINAPVAGLLAALGADVAVAGAGVVDADLIVREAAEHS